MQINNKQDKIEMNLNMNKTTHLNNETNINKLLNKGYFSLNNQKLIYILYLLMKTDFNKRLGRKCKSKFNLELNHANIEPQFYIVDSTTLRIGKGKNEDTYSDYKHHHGFKFQVTINNQNLIQHVSKSYASSIHDKNLFLKEYNHLIDIIKSKIKILGDKGYSGLKDYDVEIPIKCNELIYKQDKLLSKVNNKSLSSKRIKIEHVFAYIKKFRIMQRLNYYSIDKIEILFHSIANIYNLQQFIKI